MIHVNDIEFREWLDETKAKGCRVQLTHLGEKDFNIRVSAGGKATELDVLESLVSLRDLEIRCKDA